MQSATVLPVRPGSGLIDVNHVRLRIPGKRAPAHYEHIIGFERYACVCVCNRNRNPKPQRHKMRFGVSVCEAGSGAVPVAYLLMAHFGDGNALTISRSLFRPQGIHL